MSQKENCWGGGGRGKLGQRLKPPANNRGDTGVFPKVREEADGLDLGISTATLWVFFTAVPTSLKAINPHVTFLCDAKIMLAG